jgi:hypothetical protein
MSDPGPPQDKKPLNFWRLVATMSSLGWSLVLPIAGGALLGHYLDGLAGEGVAWTVGLLFAGVSISLYNLVHILFKDAME